MQIIRMLLLSTIVAAFGFIQAEPVQAQRNSDSQPQARTERARPADGQARQRPTAPPQGNPRDQMWNQLGLTDKQKADIKAINDKYDAQMTLIRTSTTMNDAQKRAAAQEIMTLRRTDTEKVLTAEQKKKMEQLRQEARQRQPQRTPGATQQRPQNRDNTQRGTQPRQAPPR